MTRRSDTDRLLFGVTLVLCLLGAVMIFSASAVTAQNQYGHSYFFVLRQIAWLVLGLLGMFALMRLDYHRLREPAVVYTGLCLVGLMLVGAFFLDKSHATHRWIKLGPVNIQPSELAKLAVILYLAWFLDMRRRTAVSMEFNKQDFLQTLLPAIAPILVCVALILAATRSRNFRGHRADHDRDSFRRGTLVEMARRWPSHSASTFVRINHARFLSPGALDGFPPS